ncbi:hypothetical protein ENSA5_66280 [Enhygromyxa salina]|uniref:Uncharacterized protein n=1 Tax=Enhygromyxa salina TaxID=215803 RepID=A0A2S9XBN1_9BACT|nr:hypothetical protein ENSA5_66280 [Enhygromyxa salina]
MASEQTSDPLAQLGELGRPPPLLTRHRAGLEQQGQRHLHVVDVLAPLGPHEVLAGGEDRLGLAPVTARAAGLGRARIRGRGRGRQIRQRPVTIVDHGPELAAHEAEGVRAQELDAGRVGPVARVVDRLVEPARHERVELQDLLGRLERAGVRGHARELGELGQHPRAQRVQRADRRGRDLLGQLQALVEGAEPEDLFEHGVVVRGRARRRGQGREHPSAHLGRGRPREGDRHDLLRPGPGRAADRVAARDDPEVATNQAPGLARARARDQDHRARGVEDRPEAIGGGHWTTSRAMRGSGRGSSAGGRPLAR